MKTGDIPLVLPDGEPLCAPGTPGLRPGRPDPSAPKPVDGSKLYRYAELQACLGGDDGLDSSITAARFALSEAATAALALDRRLADAAGHLATVMAEKD